MKRSKGSRGTPGVCVVAVLMAVHLACGSSEEQAQEGASVPAEPVRTGEGSGASDGGGVQEEDANPLGDTSWRLDEFQSMDDGTGVVVAPEDRTYTMHLAADGSVAMELDCNRATGAWSSDPSVSGESGSFRFGPLAVTRALCAPPRLDERFAKDAEYVRGYLLKDGRLHLSLMVDGGIYSWEPVEESAP